MPRNPTFFAMVIAVAGCGTQKAPAAGRASVRVPAVELASASQPAPGMDALYVYSPVGKRDPFMTALQPPPGTLELQKWPVDQFSLKGTVTGTASPSAVLLDPVSRAWLVRIGDYVGNKWGKVTSIERDQIIVTETIGEDRRLYPQPIKLGLSSPGSVETQGHAIDVPPRK